MRNFRNQDDYWKPCRPGTIHQAANLKTNRQRRRFVVQIAMGSVVALTGLLSAVFVTLQQGRSGSAIALGDSPADADNSVADSGNFGDAVDMPDKSLACGVITNLTPQYVNAIRQDDNVRSQQDKELVAQFDMHLQKCPKCALAVLKAVNQV